MKQERTKKAIYLRFIGIMVLCGAIGAVAGYLTVMAGQDLLETAQSWNQALAALGLWWFVPGYLLLVAGTACYIAGRALLPQAKEEDAAFRESDRRLCLALILSGASMVWLFIALGISIQASWVEGHAMWLGNHVLRVGGKTEALLLLAFLVVQLVWITALQAVIIRATKTIHPEKRGNVFDTRFQRDWFESCDEAEQQQIGQCSYLSFRVMGMVFPVVMIVLVLLAGNGMVPPAWILLVGGLWMVQQMSYQAMAYYLDHGKGKAADRHGEEAFRRDG